METITVSKQKTPEVADWAADKEPGDRVCLYGTIKANDDQTLTITLEEVGDDKSDEEEDDDAPEMGNEGADAAPATPPPGTMADMMDEESAV